MTKILIEQWRDGKLPKGCYYVRFFTTKQPYIEICGSEFLGNLAEFNGTDRAEVLAPVPDYQTWKNVREQWKVAIPQIERLQEQLKEANEILKIAIPDTIQPSGYGKILDEYIEKTLNYFKKWKV